MKIYFEVNFPIHLSLIGSVLLSTNDKTDTCVFHK